MVCFKPAMILVAAGAAFRWYRAALSYRLVDNVLHQSCTATQQAVVPPAKRGTGHRWPPAAVAQRTRRQASLCLRSRTVEGARAATLAPPVQEEPPHAPSTALRGGKIRSFSRRARVRALPTTTTPFPHRDSAPRKKGGSGAPKGACQPSPPADTGALCAARPLSGGSALLRVAFRRSAAALARANASAIGSAPVPAFPETRSSV